MAFILRRHVLRLLTITSALLGAVAADLTIPSGDEILAKIEGENNRRHSQLLQYSGARQYTMQNQRFGKQASASILMNYRQPEGERFTVLTRSGSDKLNSVIDKVLESEAKGSVPPENARHEIGSANYRVRLAGTEIASGRRCFVLELSPKIKSQSLLAGRAWVDAESYGIVRLEGQFAASSSVLIGAPHIVEDFTQVDGFWLPAHVRSVTSSLLLGATELDIVFSNYQLDKPSGSSIGPALQGR